MARKTFKERIRRNDLKQRHNNSVKLRKSMRVSKRNVNRNDNESLSYRSMDELVAEVHKGSTVASTDVLDPSALMNMLVQRDSESGRLVLKDKLANDDPAAVPSAPLPDDDEDLKRQIRGELCLDEGNSKNRYKRRGGAHVFWANLGVPEPLRKALRDIKFTHPTPVQQEVLPSLMEAGTSREDVVVSAETGSGKTLIFALPLICGAMAQMGSAAEIPIRAAGEKHPRTAESIAAKAATLMYGLVISPTRELALQIKASFEQLVQHTSIRIGCVVGGMAPTKQQRVLNTHPHILICTPGRLWELVQRNEGCYLGHSVSRRLHYLVLDEADRLLQGGRFEELKCILERVHSDALPAGLSDSAHQRRDHYGELIEAEDAKERTGVRHSSNDGSDEEYSESSDLEEGEWDDEKKEFVQKKRTGKRSDDAVLLNTTDEPVRRRGLKDAPMQIPYPPPPPRTHRVLTIVTSATLSLETNYVRRDLKSRRQVIRTSNEDTLQSVLTQLSIVPKRARVFSLAGAASVVAKVHETYLRCSEGSKELYLYYFLRTYKERAVVFVNAISMLRRLTKLLEILGIPCVALHASMQQRQRLKFIDRFKTGERRVLVATDVAARGLDVEGLRYVIHYQLPRSTDAYIHRCGRTARCGGTGMSLAMVDATEFTSFRRLLDSLGRSLSGMESFSLNPTIVHQLHPHMRLALQIDKLQKEISKSTADDQWVRKASAAADIDADDMTLGEEAKLENQAKSKALRVLQKRLAAMVRQEASSFGGKGSFRSSAQAAGEALAVEKLKGRASRQVYEGHKF